MGKFHRQYPHIDISLKISNRSELLERLQNNCDDLVIMSQLPKKISVVAEQCLKDKLVIPAPLNHPLTKKKNILLQELKKERFIIRELGSGTRIIMEQLFKKNRLQPKIIMELGSSSAIKQAVMAGFGLSVLSKISLEQELLLKKLVILDIQELPICHYWYAVHLKGKNLSPIANQFLHFLLAPHK